MLKTEQAILMLLIILPFAGSVIIGFFRSTARNNEAWFAGAVALFCFLLTVMLYPTITDGQSVTLSLPWLPAAGLNITLRIDGFAWLFLLLITGIGVLIVIYARYYMNPNDPVPRFFAFLLAFMGSMTGIALSGNLVLLVIFWELTSIFSFLLIGYWYQNSAARDGARMALIITAAGGLALLLGVSLIGAAIGSFELADVLQSGDALRRSPLYAPILVCIILAAFTKSAQFPFHFWLPNAMAAPTPASAYLHSATMVKAGIFLLARLWPVLAHTDLWFWLVCGSGVLTLLTGSYFAMFQQDLKGLLAYSTISHLGLMTTLLGFSSSLACIAAIFHMVNHATFKASLFMATGIIDHETGTRDLRKLSGLYPFMPYTASLAVIAAAAMAGVPLLNGFLSKEMFFTQATLTVNGNWLDNAMPLIATISALFTVAYSVRFIHGVFFGNPPQDLPKTPHEPPHFMRLPIEFLAFVCLLVGIIPNLSIGPLLDNAARAVLGSTMPAYSLTIQHSLTTPLFMSLIALGGGLLFYGICRNYLQIHEGAPLFVPDLSGRRIFEKFLTALSWRWARILRDMLSTKCLRMQIRWLLLCCFSVVFLIVFLHYAHYRTLLTGDNLPLLPVSPYFVLLWLIGLVCAAAAARKAKFHRLSSLVLLGGAGLVCCACFVLISAPDLALTQLAVEIITTVLLLLGLRWLPMRLEEFPAENTHFLQTWLRRSGDLALALIGGGGMAWLAYTVMRSPQDETIAHYFLENALSQAGGHNVVNVILVDFRAFDTMGEITVLAVVALSVYALLRRFRPTAESMKAPLQQRFQDSLDKNTVSSRQSEALQDYMAIPSLMIHWLFPFIIAFALYLFFRGHDWPGGGFVAGITLSVGFILQYIAAGTNRVENMLYILPLRWIGTGLLLAMGTGLGAWAFGYPFLSSYHQNFTFPLIGTIPFASALFFDAGVFCLVVGAVVLMLIALAHQSLRHYRIRQKTHSAITEDE